LERLDPKENEYASLQEDSVEAIKHYGNLSFTNIAEDNQYEFIEMNHLADNLLDRHVGISGCLYVVRRLGSKLVFFTFRPQAYTV
jgi:hypothetical protein